MITDPSEHTTCCVVGGGPAGIFVGYLLARAGVQVVILEKHSDFLRDFRGDTIHPSTMAILDELGLLEEFLPIVDFRAGQLTVNVEGRTFMGPTFTHLNTKCPFIGFAPQWDFLNLLARRGEEFPGFDLRMNTEATDLVRNGGGAVIGVRCESNGRRYTVEADLVIAADGRSSTIRRASAHEIVHQGIPIDVLWFGLDRPADDEDHTLAWLKEGRMLVTIPRRDHYQTAMVIRKGGLPEVKAAGLQSFRNMIGRVCPLLADPAQRLGGWEDVKLLTVEINRLERWHESGLLFIGDAAHAMSPVGGVGINLAVQDAVAAANLLAGPLADGTLNESHLAEVQRRREPAARKTQRLQRIIQANMFGHGGSAGRPLSLPWYTKWFLLLFAPLLRRLAGRWIGIGFQPEHIQTPGSRWPGA